MVAANDGFPPGLRMPHGRSDLQILSALGWLASSGGGDQVR